MEVILKYNIGNNLNLCNNKLFMVVQVYWLTNWGSSSLFIDYTISAPGNYRGLKCFIVHSNTDTVCPLFTTYIILLNNLLVARKKLFYALKSINTTALQPFHSTKKKLYAKIKQNKRLRLCFYSTISIHQTRIFEIESRKQFTSKIW